MYIFVRNPPVLSNTGNIAVPAYWNSTEKARLLASDAFARDHFGASIGLVGSTLVVGAPGQDGRQEDGGAVYLFDVKFASVSFSQVMMMH